MSVTLARDPMCTSKWYAYVPDRQSGWYARYEFVKPLTVGTYSPHCTLGGIFYGKVHPGQCITKGGWTENGSWSDDTNYNEWIVRQTSAQNAYIETVIPEGHNRISVVAVVRTSNAAAVGFTWNGQAASDFDISSYTLSGTANRITEIVVATNAQPDGTKKFRITKTDATSNAARIIAIRSWNTSTTGDPATLNGSSLWLGHDMVDLCDGVFGAGYRCYRVQASINDAYIISPTDATDDFAITTGPDGGTTRFTGGQNHYDAATNYVYTFNSGEYTNGPVICVDGTASYGVWDNSNNPIRKVHTGNLISITSRGVANWSSGNKPAVAVQYALTDNGLAISGGFYFIDAADVTMSFYCPMLDFAGTTNWSNGFYVKPDGLKYALPASNTTITGMDALQILLPQAGCQITAKGIQPSQIYFKQDTSKIYVQGNVSAMHSGSNVSSGSVYPFGGNIDIKRHNFNKKLVIR